MQILNEIQNLRSMAGEGSEVRGEREQKRLREACQQFEGLMLGILLKESLRDNLGGENEDSAAGLEQFRDFCVEQVATSVAESEASLGIADQLYEQLSGSGVSR